MNAVDHNNVVIFDDMYVNPVYSGYPISRA